jgi:hypothetical protein
MNSKMSKKKLQEIQDACNEQHNGNVTDVRICIINEEFKQGFEFMKKYPKSVTFFGSARFPEDHPSSLQATELAQKIAKQGYAVVTGGGGGIMGAANKGAHIENGTSLGLTIELPFEQSTNDYVSDAVDFEHFFSRKVTLAYSAEAYVYLPGGFGTLDELFEILTLKQTGKIPPVPIILFDSSFWNPLVKYFREVLIERGTISPEDTDIFVVTDDQEEVVDIITRAPVRHDIPRD